MNHCKQRDETLFSEALDSLISQGTDFCVSYGLGKPNIKNLRATVTTAQNSGIVPLTEIGLTLKRACAFLCPCQDILTILQTPGFVSEYEPKFW